MNGDPSRMTELVREMLGRHGMLVTLGARLLRASPGEVEIELPASPHISQQNGFVHAGAVSAIADSAAGAAAWTMMPQGSDVLTVEFKINLVAPAAGERLVASARVIKAGRTLTLTEADVHAFTGETKKLVAHLVATMITMAPGVESRSPVR